MNEDMNYIYYTGNTIIIELISIWMAHLRQNNGDICLQNINKRKYM